MSDNILIEYARERLANRSVPHFKIKRSKFICNFLPSDFITRFNTEEELLKLLGRKKRQQLSNLASFFNALKHLTTNYLKCDSCPDIAQGQKQNTHRNISSICAGFEYPVSIIPLSARNKLMISLYGNSTSAQRVIKLLRTIGGIQAVTSKHRFGNTHPELNFSTLYAYNKQVEKTVLQLAKKLNVPIIKPADDLAHLTENFPIEPTIFAQIRVSSKLHIKTNCSDDQIREMLAKKYSRLIAQRLAKILEMNESLPTEQHIQFNWKITRGKASIKKIGIRATSRIVSLKEHKNENSDYSGKWRWQYLSEHFGNSGYWHYDVRGSIYQITRLLNHGDWAGNSIDPYKLMFGSEFQSDADRQAYKSLCMALYFDRPKCIIIHNQLKTPNMLRKYGAKPIEDELIAAKQSMENFTGRSFDSEIFLHESLMYIDFVYALRKKKVDVVQIYDGFYFSRKDLIDVESLMRQTAANYYKDYMEFVRSESSSCD